ncbi:MAG: adenylate/guanylate cyclase domain-containing protein [Elusimicrobiota bacterium]|nr:adenylate/guanylate cyclase domain-containing protein [Elusimicrobiota bacterium]
MKDKIEKDSNSQDMDVGKIIEERERLDKLFKDKFTRVITVMFTDLKGSTSLAETHGDFTTRSVIKRHIDILTPLFKKYNGTLVKTMGDGTMSYFADPLDAVRAAVEMQKGMDEYNLEKKVPIPILMRVGIHTGEGIVEKNDIFGDIVNVASRIEAQANAGEIYMSEEAYNALSDKSEIYCAFAKETMLKGKKDPMRLYKAFWNPVEIDRDLAAKKTVPVREPEKKSSRRGKIILTVAIVLLIAFAFLKFSGISRSSDEEKRTSEHSVTLPDAPK